MQDKPRIRLQKSPYHFMAKAYKKKSDIAKAKAERIIALSKKLSELVTQFKIGLENDEPHEVVKDLRIQIEEIQRQLSRAYF